MTTQTFCEWLLSYRRDNRIRDLADDVKRSPPETEDFDSAGLRDHMERNRACREAFEALAAAQIAYARYVVKTASHVASSQHESAPHGVPR